MIGLARGLVRLALLTWPPDRRDGLGEEALDAALRGFEKRRRRGLGPAWLYLARVVGDAAAAGIAQRSRGGGEVVVTDVTLALRRLRRSPGTTLAAVAMIALGVGANAAVYGTLESIVLASPPLPEAHELGLVRKRTVEGADTSWSAWSYPEIRDLRMASDELLDGVAGYTIRRARLSGQADPEYVAYELVTPGYLGMLAPPPAAGRYFTPDEEGVDAAPGVAVLSHAVWTERFGGDAGAVGQEVTLAGSPLRIVGVAPPGFRGLTGDARIWVPVGQSRPNMGSWGMERRDVDWLDVVGRVRAGTSGVEVADRLSAIGAAVGAVEPGGADEGRVDAAFIPMAELWVSPAMREAVWFAMAAALAVLGIVAINLTVLLLVRERRRAPRTAVQLALGAGRGTILRERAVESLVLTAVGGLAGLSLGSLGVRILGTLWPESAFRGSAGHVRLVDGSAIAIDGSVAALGLLLAAVVSLVAHLLPTMLARDPDVLRWLRRAGPGSVGVGRGVAREWLLGTEVALTLVLLVASGMLAGTVWSLRAAQRGFQPDGFLMLRYDLVGRPAMRSQEATRAFHEDLRRRLEAIPGVTAVSMSSSAPLASGFITSRLDQVQYGREYAEGSGPELGVHVVDHAYFRTLGTPLLQGRTFSEAETRAAERVVVLTRGAAEAFFGSRDPVGRAIRFQMNSADPSVWWTVVGVVDDVLYRSPVEGLRPEVFVPLGVWAPVGLSAMIRTERAPGEVVSEARRALLAVDPEMAFSRVATGRELRAEDVASERALATVVIVFTSLALVLSAAGLWANVAQSVAERRREIGLRMAVGAPGGAVERLFVQRRLLPVAGGAAAGLGGALLVTDRMAGTLFGVGPRDPRVFAAAAGLLVVVCLLAAWVPARAVTRVDPVRALRS